MSKDKYATIPKKRNSTKEVDLGRFNIKAQPFKTENIGDSSFNSIFDQGFSGNDIGDNLINQYKSYVSLDDLVPADPDMNFYDPITPEKMTELVESIQNVGLQHPVVAWEQVDNKYMILSGHNRVNAFKILNESVGGDEFKKISAKIYKKDELTLAQARAIIVDTNWVARELTPMQKAKSIYVKYIELREESRVLKQKRKVNDIIAEKYNLKKRQVINYKSLVTLIPDFQVMIDAGTLSIESGVIISKLSSKAQNFLYSNYSRKEIAAYSKNLTPDVTIEDIKRIFKPKEDNSTIVKIKVPNEHTEAFLKELETLKEKYGLIFK